MIECNDQELTAVEGGNCGWRQFLPGNVLPYCDRGANNTEGSEIFSDSFED